MSGEESPLLTLLVAAGEAPPETRIEYRDPIAQFGDDAVRALATPDWIGDPHYAAFAIRTIARAGSMGAATAIPALRASLDFIANDVLRGDIVVELQRLGVSKLESPSRRAAGQSAPAPMAVDDLVIGTCYRRRDLHLAGLGGNWQKGISYPADGTYCLLFSDPSKESEYGYRDAPAGETGYRYFGEWSGSGDMTMTGGNQAIRDRSPNLYLFTDASCGRVFRGRFELVDWTTEPAVRDGTSHHAIVFALQRVEA